MSQLKDAIKGRPATSTLVNPDQIQPPSQDAALWFWNTIFPELVMNPIPRFPGQINPGLSPYLRELMQVGSAYATGAGGSPMNSGGNPYGALKSPTVNMPPNPGLPRPGSIDPWFNKKA